MRYWTAAIIGLVLVGVGAWAYVYQKNILPQNQDNNAGRELTKGDLYEFLAKAKQLNEKRDFSLVGTSTKYSEEIGIFGERQVLFAFKCWGDVCPDNGGYFITYKDVPKEECSTIGGYVVEGHSGWGRMTYGGCSPINPRE